MMANALYTFCIKRDIEIWISSSINILKYIKADHYVLIVPDEQITDFVTVTPSKFSIMGESQINATITLNYISEKLPINLKNNPGWYLQQILKIESIIKSSHERVIIWDSDTIPLKNLYFFNSDGSTNYYVGNEFNNEYFNTNLALIGIGKQIDFSFIAQVFSAYRTDIIKMISDIEIGHQMHWYDAMLMNLSGNIPQCFSEYELMGSFLYKNYGDKKIKILNNKNWSRNGKKIFKTYKSITNENLYKLSRDFDFIAVEGGLNYNILDFYRDKLKWRFVHYSKKILGLLRS